MNNWNRVDSIAVLNSVIEGKMDKYAYNLARYYNKYIDLRNYSEYSYYWNSAWNSFKQDPDLIDGPGLNVIKSVIDSVVSKLSNNKTRPFFSPVNGSYKTRQIVRQTQQYFDMMFDKLNVHKLVESAFRNACIFDTGYLFIDPFTYEVTVLPTWTVATLNTESTFGKPSKMLIKMRNVPSMLLNKYGISNIRAKYVNFEMFIDVIEGKACIYVNEKLNKEIQFKCDQLPIVQLFFTKPVYGNETTSIVDDLEGIQDHIDFLSAKMSAAEQLTPASTTFVYNGSLTGIKQADINDREGNVYEIDMDPGMSRLPVERVPSSPHDPVWQQTLEYYMQKAYDLIGMSELSAQSRKPSGLDSGVALQTMEDIESSRFETQTKQYIDAYVDLANLMIKMLPEDMDIIPTNQYNSSWKWKDVKEQANLFKVQYSAASALSKDPAERLKQVLQLTQVGLIDASKVAQYLDLPDLTDVYSGASAISDAIDACINSAIDDEVYNIPEYITYELLSKRIAVVENQLYASITRKDEKADAEVIRSLARVLTLEEVLNKRMEEEGFIQLESQEGAVSDSGLAVQSQNNAVAGISGADAIANAQPSVDQQISDNAATGLPINDNI